MDRLIERQSVLEMFSSPFNVSFFFSVFYGLGTNSQTVYHTNKLPYTFIVKLLKDEANYPLVCTFKNPYVKKNTCVC